MTRKLDFVVMGLPRGGTTAVANYLSAVRGVHCGLEVFPTFADHAEIDVPAAFLASDDPHWKPASVAEVTRRGDEITVWGNKTPTYFYRLPTLLEQLDNSPAIVCLRDLRAVAASYTRRAANPRDKSWHPGRVGLFALGDALLLLHGLRACPPGARVLTLPQAALLADGRGVMTGALAHVAPGQPADFDPARLARIEDIREKAAAHSPPPPDPAERRALTRLDRDGVTALFARPDPAPLADLRPELDAALAKAPPSPINFVRRHLQGHANPHAPAFFDIWKRHAAKASQFYGLRVQPPKTGKTPS